MNRVKNPTRFHTVADSTHVGLLDDMTGSTESVRAISAVVSAVRTGAPLVSS